MALACGQKAQAQLLLLNDADPVLPQESNESTDLVTAQPDTEPFPV